MDSQRQKGGGAKSSRCSGWARRGGGGGGGGGSSRSIGAEGNTGAGGDAGGQEGPWHAEEDPWAGHGLRVPDERNNHYFVRGMGEFVFEHLHEAESAGLSSHKGGTLE